MVRAARRLDQLLKHIVEAFIPEITLLLRHPFLQPEVRLDDELVFARLVLAHCPSSLMLRFAQPQSLAVTSRPRCSEMRRAAIICTCSSMSRRAPAASRVSTRCANCR